MPEHYRDTILRLIQATPFDIDTDLQFGGRMPTLANSEFLTNKEQGDWAEQIALAAINESSNEYRAVKYGRDDSLSAGDPGFRRYWRVYRDELNEIGKKPDLLIYHRSDLSEDGNCDLEDVKFIQRAVAAIEVRSSNFSTAEYSKFMDTRTRKAADICERIQALLRSNGYASLLREKLPEKADMILTATRETFRELNFDRRSWRATSRLKRMNWLLKLLKDKIDILNTRDYLSFTPKLEDLVYINRWIQRFGVPHYYMQVFFDRAYIISFENILRTVSDPENEGRRFSVEQHSKNQRKITINVDVQVGSMILPRIDPPQHQSCMKTLERGRRLYYVKFQGGRGYLDQSAFRAEIINARQ